MNILMACEYFYPFDRGGSEWSVFYLAQSLTVAGHRVHIVTPNYGAKEEENFFGFHITRFPFYIKLKNKRFDQISPIWFTNLFWQIVSLIFLWKHARRENADVIHLQGKYFIPAGFLLKFITGIPVIATIRDYQIICPYGLCLTRERNYRACNFMEMFTHDLKIYTNTYPVKRVISLGLVQALIAIRARLVSQLLLFFANRLDSRVSISLKEQSILKKNGLAKVKVIYNITRFPRHGRPHIPKGRTVTFVGRLTPGKGVFLLLKAFRALAIKNKNVDLRIIGDGTERSKIKKYIKDEQLTDRVKLLGHLSYEKAAEQIRRAAIVVMPSIWEEPFGRVALEALSMGTPVVATNCGALPEIIEHGKTGYIVLPKERDLSQAIQKALDKNLLLRKSILQSRKSLIDKFYTKPTDDHLKLYEKIKK